MKVTLVMPSLDIGGVERVMLRLADGLIRYGFAVDLVTANGSGPLKSEIPPGVHLVDFQSSRVIKTFPQLIRYLCQARPNAIISAKDYQNIVTLLAARVANHIDNIIVTTHIDVSVEWTRNKSLKNLIIPYLVRYTYPWAKSVVAVSNGVKWSLVRMTGLPAEKIAVIYNPVVTSEILIRAEEPLAHPWFMPGEPPVILSAGRLTAQKDYPTLIKAFAIVRRKHEARLVILGDGEERSKLEKLVANLGLKEDVDLLGFVQNPYKYMKRSSVFVLSSLWEGLPVALIEAMACGCPVISTNCPSGPSEILEGGKWGSLVPIGDTDSLAKAILHTLAFPPDRRQIQERGLQFSLDRAVLSYLELICEHSLQ